MSDRIKRILKAGMFRVANKIGLSKQMIRFMNRRIRSPRKKIKAFTQYQPTGNDVIVATYLRSGTYWTLQIAYQIAHLGEGTFRQIHDVVPWPESSVSDIVSLSDTSHLIKSPTRLRVIKTHLESVYVPYCQQAKYITVIRDPKDVFVSFYLFRGRNFIVEEWLDMYLAGRLTMASWPEHTAGYWRWRDLPNALVLTFDEMKSDLPGTVRRIADLMDVNLTPEQLKKVVEKGSFQYMKRNDRRFSQYGLSFDGKRTYFQVVRRGESGEAFELLSPEQRIRIDRFCREGLDRLGSDFPYDEVFKKH